MWTDVRGPQMCVFLVGKKKRETFIEEEETESEVFREREKKAKNIEKEG